MGGWGSGRQGGKDIAEHYCRLNISFLLREGFIVPACKTSGTLRWTWGGEPSSNINFYANGEGDSPYFQPSYTNTTTKEKFEYNIPLLKTFPHYGGVRWWFACPCCSKRVGVLYLGAKYFACRGCYHLAYQCQRETPTDRNLRRAQKISEQLGGEGMVDWLPKPKGMHWKTYLRKMEAMERYEQQSYHFLMEKFRNLGVGAGGVL